MKTVKLLTNGILEIEQSNIEYLIENGKGWVKNDHISESGTFMNLVSYKQNQYGFVFIFCIQCFFNVHDCLQCLLCH